MVEPDCKYLRIALLRSRSEHSMDRQCQLSVFSYDPMDDLEGYFLSAAIYALPICIIKPMVHRGWSVHLTH